MLKKFILALLGITAATSLQAASITVTLPSAAVTNVPVLINGSLKVTQFILTAPTNGAVSVLAVDDNNPTNALSYVLPSYTNTVSYVTNNVIAYTNYYGVLTLLTNKMLVDYTNNVVLASTNPYPVRFSAVAAASTAARFDQVPYYFYDGLLLTNNSSFTETVTITYQQ